MLRRDGKHSVILTGGRDISDYFYPTKEDIFIYWTYIKATNNYILTRYGGVTPDLQVDEVDKKVEGYRKFRPVTVAFLPRDEARAMISGSEFIVLKDSDIEKIVKKVEGYKSVKYKRLLDHVIREWQAERDANLIKIETSFKRGLEVGHQIVKLHLLGVAADMRVSVVERVTSKLREKKVQIPLLLIFMFLMLYLFA